MSIGSTNSENRKVIVTGAAGGIGRAIVEALTNFGCTVGGCDVTPVDAIETRAAARASFDVRDREATRRGIGELVEALGGCDAIVANAGVVDTIHRAERFSEKAWRLDIDSNLSGAFWAIQAAFPALAESGDGRVVAISSMAATSGLPGQVAYAASKAGMLGMIRTLASEWGRRGITCNAILPGMIGTPKVRALPQELLDTLCHGMALGRIGKVEELAGVVTFLLSPAAAYITGAALPVDGGIGLGQASLSRRK